MFRLAIAFCAATVLALAQAFTFTVGNPVAAQDFRAKTAAFVFRAEGCPEAAKLQVGGTVEGLAKGKRQSLNLKLAPMSTPGVYAVYPNWPAEGEWVVNLKGTCASAVAGGIIPIGRKDFIRESSRFFPHRATEAEIESFLKTRDQERGTPGGSK